MDKREFIKRILMGTGVVAASGAAVTSKTEPGVVNVSGPFQCGTCGDHLMYLTSVLRVIDIGYVDVKCFRCQKTWRIPIPKIDAQRIPNAPV